jgi:hypothetical protein
MKKSTNYGFNLPETNDFYDIEHMNANFSKADEKLKAVEETANKAENDLEKIVNGTTTVGNANKLGGKGAEEWQADLKQVTGTEITKSILQQALDVSEGVYNYTHIGGGSYPASDLPSVNYAYSPATIIKRSSADIVVILWGRKSGGYTYPTAINIYGDSGWNGWKTLATTADLANYLPLSGGTLSGVVTQTTKGDYASYRLKNSTGTIDSEFMLHGQMGSGIFNNLTEKWVMRTNLDGTSVFNGTASGNLPLSGGRLTGTLFTQDAGMEAEWVGHLRNRNGITYVGGTNADSTLYRVLAIISPNYSEVDEATALRYEYTSADGIKSDIILHTGNIGDYTANIQNTASGATGGMGWYRVAELASASYIDSPSCFISLKKTSSRSESVLLRLDVTVQTQRFALLSSVNNTHFITAVRLTTDGSKTYIEMYHCHSSEFNYHVSILDSASRTVPWKANAPIATADTVDGVTVLTTYNIVANATPATSADLANYLPKSGGTLSAENLVLLSLKNTANTGYATIAFSNGGGMTSYLGVDKDGEPFSLNGAWDWNTRKLLHTGNVSDYALPLSGGELTGNNETPLIVKNGGNANGSFIQFSDTNGRLGDLGVYSNGSPFFKSKDGNWTTLLHTGNSNAVKIQSTAPTDTSALWVW